MIENILMMLKKSTNYSHLEKIQLLYETETTSVYSVELKGYENIKIKVSKSQKSLDSF